MLNAHIQSRTDARRMVLVIVSTDANANYTGSMSTFQIYMRHTASPIF